MYRAFPGNYEILQCGTMRSNAAYFNICIDVPYCGILFNIFNFLLAYFIKVSYNWDEPKIRLEYF